jgi:hypothetical protein
MSDEIQAEKTGGDSEEEPMTSGASAARHGRKIAVIVVAVCLVAAGVGVAIAESSGTSGASTPEGAVSRLLAAADHSDLLGAIDAIAPGERTAIEPGLVGFVHQLERLDVLSVRTNLNDIGGLSLQFSNIKTATTMLSSRVAAVAITGGSVTESVEATKLPLGSFVSGLVQSFLPSQTTKSARSVSTGRGAIVTEEVGGTWYVSLGYTIAYDALRAAGRPTAPPAVSEAVSATGSSTPSEAVSALVMHVADLDLRGLLGDLPPGEMGPLQSYAPLFLGKAEAELAKVRSRIGVTITSLTLTSSPIAGGTLVKASDLGFTARVAGIPVSYKGGCLTYGYKGRSVRQCPTRAASSAEIKKIIATFPPALRGLVTRLVTIRPAVGFVTVEEGGRWFVSPVATLLDDMDVFLTVLRPGDLLAIASLAENRTEAEALAHSLEELLLGSLMGLAAAAD